MNEQEKLPEIAASIDLSYISYIQNISEELFSKVMKAENICPYSKDKFTELEYKDFVLSRRSSWGAYVRMWLQNEQDESMDICFRSKRKLWLEEKLIDVENEIKRLLTENNNANKIGS